MAANLFVNSLGALFTAGRAQLVVFSTGYAELEMRVAGMMITGMFVTARVLASLSASALVA